jgi:YgiT-type zinc finger domain-containing protein
MEPDLHCEICQIGARQHKLTTLTYWVGGRLALVPSVPIYVCDMCGDVEFDFDVLARLETVFGPGSSFGEPAGVQREAGGATNAPFISTRRWST